MNITTLNPEHVNRLNHFNQLEADKFTGSDACLTTSLAEYGLAWRPLEDGSYLFVYGIAHDPIDRRNAGIQNEDYTTFDRCSLTPEEMTWENFSFACRPEVESTTGELEEKTPMFIYDLLKYFGYENMFGATYHEGFYIVGLTPERDQDQAEREAQDAWEKHARLIITDATGVYIPQRFAEEHLPDDHKHRHEFDDVESEGYWEAWQELEQDYENDAGETLYLNGDLWLIQWDKLNAELEAIAQKYDVDADELNENLTN